MVESVRSVCVSSSLVSTECRLSLWLSLEWTLNGLLIPFFRFPLISGNKVGALMLSMFDGGFL